jgi:hypothetical protein
MHCPWSRSPGSDHPAGDSEALGSGLGSAFRGRSSNRPGDFIEIPRGGPDRVADIHPCAPPTWGVSGQHPSGPRGGPLKSNAWAPGGREEIGGQHRTGFFGDRENGGMRRGHTIAPHAWQKRRPPRLAVLRFETCIELGNVQADERYADDGRFSSRESDQAPRSVPPICATGSSKAAEGGAWSFRSQDQSLRSRVRHGTQAGYGALVAPIESSLPGRGHTSGSDSTGTPPRPRAEGHRRIPGPPGVPDTPRRSRGLPSPPRTPNGLPRLPTITGRHRGRANVAFAARWTQSDSPQISLNPMGRRLRR